MAKHNGMSYIQPYYNKFCTREIPFIDGVFKFDISYVESEILNNVPISIWIRNDGSHKAYSIKATCTNGEVQNITVVDEIESGEVKRITFNLNITGGYVGYKEYNIEFEYDSL